MTSYYQKRQKEIMESLCVAEAFDAARAVDERINFIKKQWINTGKRCMVLGLSGGIDSTLAGRLISLAAAALRGAGVDVHFIAMRLPYGIQKDAHDAKDACDFVAADEILTVDIKPACEGMVAALCREKHVFLDKVACDFIIGNIKARQRMIAQYAIAGLQDGLVVGTDHAAEALMGFFTKFGDGACDLAPLSGLTKRRIKAMATYLSAPPHLVHKVPTADLECLAPLKPDEQVFGLSYEVIDDFLEGRVVSDEAYEKIIKTFDASAHKRALPVTPFSP